MGQNCHCSTTSSMNSQFICQFHISVHHSDVGDVQTAQFRFPKSALITTPASTALNKLIQMNVVQSVTIFIIMLRTENVNGFKRFSKGFLQCHKEASGLIKGFESAGSIRNADAVIQRVYFRKKKFAVGAHCTLCSEKNTHFCFLA